MLSTIDFVRQSLELHLFFMRIMKEHSFFLQVGFTPRDANFSQQADAFRMQFDELYAEVISLSNGVVSPEALESGEAVTPYTQRAETATAFLSGVRIPTQLTQAQAQLMGGNGGKVHPALEQRVAALNQRAMALISSLIQFKNTILLNVLACKMFTVNYPLLIDHIMREARLYLRTLQRIQSREYVDIQREAFEQELFWNQIMAEHSKFIAGLLDPTEETLIDTARNFGKEFDQLNAEAKAAINMTIPQNLTDETIRATRRLRDFKEQGTQGLLKCDIRSIIIPLLGDHVLRESNHYLRLLRIFSSPASKK